MSQENFDELYKIVLIGDSGVGKSNILSRYIHDEFSIDTKTTVGVEFGSKIITISNKKLKIQLWDTAGQEIYRNVNKLFLKNSNIVIFVYDITSKSSYENILKYWYDEIMSILKKEDIVCGIAGNKVDLYENEKVKFEEVKKYAKSIGAYAKETSAKNYESINHLIQFLVKKYISISDKNEVKKGFQLSIPETNPSSSC